MKTPILIGSVCLATLAGCGLEGLFANAKHVPYDRPASALLGSASWSGANGSQISAIDGSGNAVEAFSSRVDAGRYELKLPSSKYSMIRVQGRAGNFVLRALVPSIGEETALDPVDLDARNMTESLIVEARLSADGKKLQQLTPAAYVGDGVTTGTRTLIRQAFDATAPTAAQLATQQLLHMVEQVMQQGGNPAVSATDPSFFRLPVLTPTFAVTASPLDASFLVQSPIDYDPATPGAETTSVPFDQKLAQVAQLYDPSGCAATDRIRLVFSVDFNQGALNGNCGSIDRFKWAKDAPGKKMFFVGWVHRESEIQDPALNMALGASVPNTIPMYDDGTNGDETAGDNIWTVFFDVPLDPAQTLRIGYKYTWGFQGAPWTGSEEWPGNSRILEVVDVNGDDFVHRRDVFGDEATNKDRSNLNLGGTGSITWTTVLLGAPAGCVDLGGIPIPEAREQPSTTSPASACTCTTWLTPQSIGPLRVACGP